MFQLFINSYLKGLDVDRAILIAKQFSIDFSYNEMSIALPYLKKNYMSFLNEKSKIHALNDLANISSPHIANKCEQLINKLLIILS